MVYTFAMILRDAIYKIILQDRINLVITALADQPEKSILSHRILI